MECLLNVQNNCIDSGEDINFEDYSIDANDKYFNGIIGHIEDIIMNEEFHELQTEFMERNWQEFDETEENKFIYTDIFKEYTDLLEKFIGDELLKIDSNFHMEKFINELQNRRNSLEGEIFEILFSLTDFMAFKEIMLDYKAMKEGRAMDFTTDISICKLGNIE